MHDFTKKIGTLEDAYSNDVEFFHSNEDQLRHPPGLPVRSCFFTRFRVVVRPLELDHIIAISSE
ncbi:unnamed protein product [Gongylonema pulchrum]|uniref:CUB domain-containing protein n=1 Tax=Gongylonema pulchrum TaxID=637853 RepID=A0A183EPI4_9BILA|nr:unnamed protein product [Gongylonema pulchrum]